MNINDCGFNFNKKQSRKANVITVGLDCLSDYETINEALEAAEENSIIYVGQGTYNEELVITKNVRLIGDSDEKPVIQVTKGIACIIQSDADICNIDFENTEENFGEDDDQRKSVKGLVVIEGDSAKLTNCAIRNSYESGLVILEKSNAIIQMCEISGSHYENVILLDESNPIFIGCKIFDGLSEGLWIRDKSKGSFMMCEIFQNVETNILLNGYANPHFKLCNISGGNEVGLLINGESQGTFTCCNFDGNKTAGVYLSNKANPVFARCAIKNTKGDSGLICVGESKGVFTECEFGNNGEFNAVFKEDSDPLIKMFVFSSDGVSSLLFEDNAKGHLFGGMINGGRYGIAVTDNSSPFVEKCQIEDCSDSGIRILGSGSGKYRYVTFNNIKGDNVSIDSTSEPYFSDVDL